MTVNLCINTGTHDASVTIMKDGKLLVHIVEERLSHRKHDAFPVMAIDKVKEYVDFVDNCSFTDLHHQSVDFKWLTQLLFKSLHPNLWKIWTSKSLNSPLFSDGSFEYNVFQSHHDLHAIVSLCHSGFDDAVLVVIDGAGSTYSYGKENQTIYEVRGENLEIKERVIVGDGSEVVDVYNQAIPNFVKDTTNIGAGYVYASVTECLSFNAIDCGKTMGLSAYGEDDENIPQLISFENCGNNNFTLGMTKGHPQCGYTHAIINEHPVKDFYVDDYIEIPPLDLCTEEQLRLQQNLAYRVQDDYEKYLIYTCKRALERSNSRNLILSGGCALNCVANYKLLKSLPEDVNLYVEPVSDDSGVGLGGAYCLTDTDNFKLESLYLGGQLEYDYELLGNNEIEYDVEPENVAEIISNGNIVAIAQGRSEIGPRALGNRSILFDPRVKNGKDIVNEVKNREYFRPFAGTVLKEYARDWFDMDRLDESPFMMYAVDVLPDKIDLIPSIVHVDGTCRIQTVTSEQNKNYYNLITEFYKLTGVPILFNTSFNLAGDTMVETIDDAFYTLRSSQINYMYLPEIGKLIQIN